MTISPGKLFLIATPIGNLRDITLRALDTLREVQFIACEDTRQTLKLLNAYQIQKPLISLHQHNEARRVPEMIARMKQGESVALVSDAGTPLISDPGHRLVRACLSENIPLESIPGPSALINGLVLSGLDTERFYFVGFLPPKSSARQRRFQELKEFPDTLVFFESPHRIQKFLEEAYPTFGPRPLALAREMTKRFEEVYRGPLLARAGDYPLRSWKGEFVVILAGFTPAKIPKFP